MRKQATTSLIMFLSSSFATLLVVIPLLLHSFAVVIGNGGTGAVILAAAVSQPSDIPPYVYPERRPKYPKTSVKERLALIDLHTATRGARWKVKWDTSGGPCSHGWCVSFYMNNAIKVLPWQASSLVLSVVLSFFDFSGGLLVCFRSWQ